MKNQSKALALSVLVLVLTSATSTLASTQTLGSMRTTVEELSTEEAASSPEALIDELNASSFSANNAEFDVPGTLVIIDQIMNLGARAWKVVEANRPVANATGVKASALPEGITQWAQLAGWKSPRSKLVHMQYTNRFGMTVVDFTYRITYTYGGSYNSQGQYLTNVSVVPSHLFVAWGYRFNASAEVANTVNIQTSAHPIAGMEIGVSWKVDNVIISDQNSNSYFIKGTGELTDLSRGN